MDGDVLFAWFEKLVDPYPSEPPATPPKRFASFLWACTRGLRLPMALMTLFTAAIGAFEAWLFAALGHIVDWLAGIPAGELWSRERDTLALLAGVLASSIVLAALQTTFKHQALAANFPMRMRWNFHRLLLDQSMHFFQDEFAGRIATKVMQTALAVRDVWLIVADILVYVVIYFLTMIAVLGGFDAWLLLPFLLWLGLYLLAMRHFVPRIGRVAREQADARSLMTGRITDAYTNIATVKLFSHTRREAAFAKGAMQEFMVTAHRQMRLVSAFEITNQALSVLLIGATSGIALWLWGQDRLGIGAVAAATAMALRLNGISHWVMWELASLFESLGTVQDGINTLSRPVQVVDRPDAGSLRVERGEIRFEGVEFSYGGGPRVIDGLTLTIRPGGRSAWWGVPAPARAPSST